MTGGLKLLINSEKKSTKKDFSHKPINLGLENS